MSNMDEPTFPRGGTITRKRGTRSETAEPNLFQLEVREGKSKKRKIRSDNVSYEPDNKKAKRPSNDQAIKITYIEPLGGMLLTTGMAVFGIISEIKDYQMVVSLPGCKRGIIPITKVSKAYTKLLSKYADRSATVEEIQPLSDMFAVGCMVSCMVVEKNEKKEIILTLNPTEVNGSLSSADLYDGMILQTSVKSCEDHGYIMELGIKGVHGFLSVEAAEGYIKTKNSGKAITVGQVFPCVVDLPNIDEDTVVKVIKLKSDPRKVMKAKIKIDAKVSLHTLLPGMQVEGTVTKICASGLRVQVHNFVGVIHKSHLRESWDTPQQYAKGTKVVGRILYVHPLLKVIYLSIQSCLSVPNDRFQGLNKGDLISNAVVVEANKNCVWFKINDGVKGFCKAGNLSNKKRTNADPKKFIKVGSEHRCRIVGFSYVDNAVLVSMKSQIVNTPYIKYSDLKPGNLLNCTVLAIHPSGISVQVTPGISGFIPNLHNADYPLRYPDRKYKPNQELSCKVLCSRPDQVMNRLILTNKESLKSSKSVLASYEDAKPGSVVDGVVVYISDIRILVAFYNDVKGVIDQREMVKAGIDIPENKLYLGQVVSCVVCHSNARKKQLFLRLQRKLVESDKLATDEYEIGKIDSCTVAEVKETGLEVIISSSGLRAVLPSQHLSDHSSNCEKLLQTYQVGEIIQEVINFSHRDQYIVSKKPCLIRAANNGELRCHSTAFQEGDIVPAVIKQHFFAKLMLEFPNSVLRKVDKMELTDSKLETTWLKKTTCGTTIMVKVKSVINKTLILSTRLSQCYRHDPYLNVIMLSDFLEEGERIRQHYLRSKDTKKKLAALTVGQIVPFKITMKSEIGVVGELANGLSGLATHEHMKSNSWRNPNPMMCEVGDEVDAVVLATDMESECAELCPYPPIVAAVRKLKDNPTSVAQEGQDIKGEAILLKDDYILVLLKGHAAGRFCYLPARKHMNDFVGKKNLYTIGAEYRCIIKRVENDRIIAVLKEHDIQISGQSVKTPETEVDEISDLKKPESIPTSCGPIECHKIYDAVIKAVESRHLKIFVRNVFPGTVNITDIVDDIADGANPLESYKEGQNISVRVLRFKSLTTGKVLAISHKTSKSIAICSVKPSALDSCYKAEDETQKMFQPGDQVVGFVHSFQQRYLVLQIAANVYGKVFNLNISNDVKVVKKSVEIFEVGYACHATVVSKLKSGKCKYELTMTGLLKLKPGCVVNGLVRSCRKGIGSLLRLPFGYVGQVCLTDLSDNYETAGAVLHKIDAQWIVRCAVIHVNAKNKKATLSLRTSRIKGSRKSTSNITDPELMLGDIKLGLTLRGFVKNIDGTNVIITLGRDLDGLLPRAKLPESLQSGLLLQGGMVVKVSVTAMNEEDSSIELDWIESPCLLQRENELASAAETQEFARPLVPKRLRSASESSSRSNSPGKRTKNELRNDEAESSKASTGRTDLVFAVKGKRKRSVSESSSVVSISAGNEKSEEEFGGKLAVVASPIKADVSKRKRRVSDISNASSSHSMSVIKKLIPKDVKKSKVDEKDSEGTPKQKKSSMDNGEKEAKGPSVSSNDQLPKSLILLNNNTPKLLTNNIPRLDADVTFKWLEPEEVQVKKAVDSSSDDDGDDDEEQPATATAKKKTQKIKEKEEEDRLRKVENLLADDEREPQTVDDFDRLVLTSPDSSIVWLKYMAFHLQEAEVNKARGVAERALKTISFREEQEKLNVWVSLLNVENLYGTDESVDEVFRRAVQYNEPIKVYNQLANIYIRCNKNEQAEQLYNKMMKRFRLNKEVWISFGLFLMQIGRLEPARKLLQRCLQSLPTKDHVDVICKFGQLEFKYGDVGRGRTVFENLLSNYPRRTDLWSVYINLMIKAGDLDTVREILEQAITLKVSPKQMKIYFKKYLDFEQQYGNEETVEQVRKKAKQYVDCQVE